MDNIKPNSERLFLPVKYDVIFRLFFADERNNDELVSLLKSVLRLPWDEYESIEIADPNLLPEYIGDKYAIIDIKLHTKSHKTIQIEVQLQVQKNMMKRIIFYNAKLITEQMGSGDRYDKIQNVVSIIITDEDLIADSQKYHHRFTHSDLETNVELTDLSEIHTIELSKLPISTDGTALYDWAKFIAAETYEELDMCAKMNPQVSRAVVKLRELSADERARDMYERRLKGWRDFESSMDDAEYKGRTIVARNLLKRNRPIDEIMEDTGLSRIEIESL